MVKSLFINGLDIANVQGINSFINLGGIWMPKQ
jgi:hypothetical protein